VHVLVTMYAQMNDDGTPCPELEHATDEIVRLATSSKGGVVLLDGVGPDKARWQDLSAVLRDQGDCLAPTNKEHFGLSDGFGDPVFSGQFSGEAERLRVAGGGKLLPDQSWSPLATGEFLLGYPDEAQEIAGGAMPIAFSRNGTFMAYRKLHEDVGRFHDYIDEQAQRYARMFKVPQGEAVDTIKAKIVGRWHDGIPLMAAPTYADWQSFKAELDKAQAEKDKPKLAEIALRFTKFTYASDPSGSTCPMTSHLRRANPRDTLGPTFDAAGNSKAGSVLVNRRRILRRGLPYGRYDRNAPRDDGDHGIVFMALCTSLFRQFEFVQQQWMQYGLDFNTGSDTCPVIGNHPEEDDPKLLIPVDPALGRLPFICDRLPQLVEPRGGDYFFIPSMTALRMIGTGIIDPT
jgi:Dyp-type peroxidase family